MELSPSVYEHAAALIQRSPWEVSRDPNLLYEAHAEAYRIYRHSPIMPGIDIYNLEAEAYGAVVENPGGTGIPAITKPLCGSAADILKLKPLNARADGRIPMAIETAAKLAKRFPDSIVRMPLSGPFSIASNLLGFENLLCEAAEDPGKVKAALFHLVDGQANFADAVKSHGVDVAFFESAACPPLLSPALFREVELPALKAVLARLEKILGHPVPCIIGGNTEPILDAILETGTKYVVAPFETDQAAFMEKINERTDVRVRVNTDVELISHGTWEQIRGDANRIVVLLRKRSNVCAGTGSLPYDTPPENVLRLRDYLRDIN